MKYFSFLFFFAIANVWAQPEWAKNPAIDPNVYTGIGIGDSLTAAKLDAKNQITSSIRSTNSFFLNQTIETLGNKAEQKTTYQASSSSKNMMLPEIDWVNTTIENGLFYTLGQVDKKEFIRLYEQHLYISLSRYQSQLNKRNFEFNEYLSLLSKKEKLETLAEQASLISSASEKGKQHLRQIIILLKNINEHSSSICMRVSYKGSSSFENKIFTPMIENAFSNMGITLKNKIECEPIVIRVNSDVTKNEAHRTDEITLFLDIGLPISISKIVTFYGQSSGSKKNSYADSVMNFDDFFHHKMEFSSFIFEESKSSLVIK